MGRSWSDAMFSMTFTLSNPLTSSAPFFCGDTPVLDEPAICFVSIYIGASGIMGGKIIQLGKSMGLEILDHQH